MDEKLADDILAIAGSGGAVVDHLIDQQVAELVSAESLGGGKLVEEVSEN